MGNNVVGPMFWILFALFVAVLAAANRLGNVWAAVTGVASGGSSTNPASSTSPQAVQNPTFVPQITPSNPNTLPVSPNQNATVGSGLFGNTGTPISQLSSADISSLIFGYTPTIAGVTANQNAGLA